MLRCAHFPRTFGPAVLLASALAAAFAPSASARVNLITAQRDRVVASYSLVNAMGRLNSRALGLKVKHYSPKIHYDQVKDLWIGLSTPDGR